MPKKFGGEDTRGIKAKAQKAAASAEKAGRTAAAKRKDEDAEWGKGSNKRAAAKAADKATKDAAKAEARRVKRELEALDSGGGTGPLRGRDKVAARKAAAAAADGRSRARAAAPAASATGLDAALLLMGDVGLKAKASAERHPERRMKAAFRAYEERELPLLRREFPSLKRSQLKERLWKLWQKSDENPMNGESVAYNAKAGGAAAGGAAAGDAEDE